jgi:hypothetical protein
MAEDRRVLLDRMVGVFEKRVLLMALVLFPS